MPIRNHYPLWLAGTPHEGDATLEVRDKYRGSPLCTVARAQKPTVLRAIERAHASFPEVSRRAAYKRRADLEHIMRGLESRSDEFAEAICRESGKPITSAVAEVVRAQLTLRIAMEESTRIGGELIPLDIADFANAKMGVIRRFSLGVCGFITPFNFPLNLVVHKIAPAIAAGCPFVLKPASTTPVTALLLGELLKDSDLPADSWSILPCSSGDAEPIVTDDRIAKLSFTGSMSVGWDLKSKAGRKRVTLELGGNAACIVDADADLDRAAERIVYGAYAQSGQSCISVQRILAHREVLDDLRERLRARIAELVMGDPMEKTTNIGPLISEEDGERIAAWVGEAVDAGAKVVARSPGEQGGAMHPAVLLEGVAHDAKVSCDEVFGPVATLEGFDDFYGALRIANDSRYGLQAGVFTNTLDHAWRAFEALEVGGVIVNDVPTFRVDAMPYGGVKESGIGREGVRWAIREMMEERLMVVVGG
mgnify:FL=1